MKKIILILIIVYSQFCFGMDIAESKMHDEKDFYMSCAMDALITNTGLQKMLGYTDRNGFNYLMKFAQSGYYATVAKLLNAGFPVNIQHIQTGKTALMLAIENNHLSIASLLASATTVILADNLGRTAFDYACNSGNFDLIGEIGKLHSRLMDEISQHTQAATPTRTPVTSCSELIGPMTFNLNIRSASATDLC